MGFNVIERGSGGKPPLRGCVTTAAPGRQRTFRFANDIVTAAGLSVGSHVLVQIGDHEDFGLIRFIRTDAATVGGYTVFSDGSPRIGLKSDYFVALRLPPNAIRCPARVIDGNTVEIVLPCRTSRFAQAAE